MFAQERHQAIATLLARRHKISVAELESALEVSPATLRRDLSEMEAAGRVIRMRGAVVHPDYFRGEPNLVQKSRAAGAAKRRIAEMAAPLVPPSSTVFLDAGSTCLALGRLLLSRADLTIITHSLPLAVLATHPSGARVLCTGGEVRPLSGALVGAWGLSWLEHLHADWCFLSASGLSKTGASTTEMSEAAMKGALLQRADNKVLLADARKWNRPAAVEFASWSEFGFWITDAPPEAVRAVKLQGVHVVSAIEKTE